MPKQNDNTLLLVAALVGGYFVINKMKSGPTRRGMVDVGPTEITDSAGTTTGYQEQVDAVIDTGKQNISLPEAVDQAKTIAADLDDAKVLIKHQGKHFAIRKGRKKVKPAKHRKVKRLRGKKLKKGKKLAPQIQAATASMRW